MPMSDFLALVKDRASMSYIYILISFRSFIQYAFYSFFLTGALLLHGTAMYHFVDVLNYTCVSTNCERFKPRCEACKFPSVSADANSLRASVPSILVIYIVHFPRMMMLLRFLPNWNLQDNLT